MTIPASTLETWRIGLQEFGLPDIQSRAFILRLQEKTFKQIGSELGVNAGRAGQLVKAASQRLERMKIGEDRVDADVAAGGVVGEPQRLTESSPVKELGFDVRILNRLKWAKLLTIGDLLATNECRLGQIRQFGAIGIQKIQLQLENHGFGQLPAICEPKCQFCSAREPIETPR